MLPFLMVASALAGGPNALTQLVREYPPPTIAARCGSLELVAGSAEALASMPLPDMPEALSALNRAALEQAGFDLEGPVTLVSWEIGGEKPMILRLPYSGDEARLEAWLGDLGAPAQRLEHGSWAVGKKGERLHLKAGMLELREGTAPTGPGWSPPPGLIDDLPDEGCAFVVRMGEESEKFPKLEAMALHADAGEESDLFVRVLLSEEAPAGLLREGRERPALGRSKDRPAMLLSMGVDPIAALQAALRAPGVPGKLQGIREPVDQLDELLTAAGVELAPGTSAALWREGGLLKRGPALRYAAVIPLRQSGGGHIPGGRLEQGVVQALEAHQIPVTEADGVHTARLGRISLSFAARRDRLYVASDPDTLDQSLARVRGHRWGDRKFRNFARDQAVALQGGIPGVAGGANGLVGLRAEGPMVEFTVSGSGTVGAAGAGMLGAIAIPNFVAMQQKARRAELPGALAEIRIAEMAYEAAFDEFLALPPSPRPVEALSREAVPWPRPEAWERLGWRPDEDLRGTYWVEVSEDGGFVVHGMIDADGDGVPAHYTVSKDETEPVQLTPKDVY